MNCREFDETWDELFDARGEASGQIERRLEEHALVCPRCRMTSDRNQTLRHAIAGLRTPMPSAASIERLYALTVPSPRISIPFEPTRPDRRLIRPLAASAALALAYLGVSGWLYREPVEERPPIPTFATIPRPPLGLTLAGFSEATLDFARKTSEPASKFSREVLELGLGPGRTEDAVAEVDPDPADTVPPASGLIRAVGARVKPLSHAFSFLLPADDSAPASPPGLRRDSL